MDRHDAGARARERQEAVRRVDERRAAAAQRARQADLLPQDLGPARRARPTGTTASPSARASSRDVARPSRAARGRAPSVTSRTTRSLAGNGTSPYDQAHGRRGGGQGAGRATHEARELSWIFDIPIDLGRPEDLLRADHAAGPASGDGPRPPRRVMYANAHVLNQSAGNAELRGALESADLVYCDGYGVRLAAKALDAPIPHRMTGADWIWSLAALCEQTGESIYLLGSEPGDRAARAAERLAATLPGARRRRHTTTATSTSARRTTTASSRTSTPAARASCSSAWARRSRSCGCRRNAHRLDVDVLWTVGALFDVVSGKVPRAPGWLADNGLEWIFRLAIEPGRMWRRYLLGNPVFVRRVMTQARARGTAPAPEAARSSSRSARSAALSVADYAGRRPASRRSTTSRCARARRRARCSRSAGFGVVRLLLPARAARARAAVGAAGRRVRARRSRSRRSATRACRSRLNLRGRPRRRSPRSASSRCGARGLPAPPASLARRSPGRCGSRVLVACVALVPMFRAGFATVPGNGSDAHLAVGTAHFLQDHPPTDVAPEEPVDRVPLVWRSKPPIYYPLAAVATVTGHGDVGGVRAGRRACCSRSRRSGSSCSRATRSARAWPARRSGMARRRPRPRRAPDRRRTRTSTSCGASSRCRSRCCSRGGRAGATRGAVALLALFLAVGAFAYPLLLPIPLVALAVLLWPERGRLRGAVARPRSLLWIVPLAARAAVPAARRRREGWRRGRAGRRPDARRCATWGGDLVAFVPEHQFVALPSTAAARRRSAPLLVVAIVCELRRQPRALALGARRRPAVRRRSPPRGSARATSAGTSTSRRSRSSGRSRVLLAAVGVSRLRRCAWRRRSRVLVWLARRRARATRCVMTFDQTPPRGHRARASVDARLPPRTRRSGSTSSPRTQLWVAVLPRRPAAVLAAAAARARATRTSRSRARPTTSSPSAGSASRSTPPASPLWSGERYVLYRQRAPCPGTTSARGRCSRPSPRSLSTATLPAPAGL